MLDALALAGAAPACAQDHAGPLLRSRLLCRASRRSRRAANRAFSATSSACAATIASSHVGPAASSSHKGSRISRSSGRHGGGCHVAPPCPRWPSLPRSSPTVVKTAEAPSAVLAKSESSPRCSIETPTASNGNHRCCAATSSGCRSAVSARAVKKEVELCPSYGLASPGCAAHSASTISDIWGSRTPTRRSCRSGSSGGGSPFTNEWARRSALAAARRVAACFRCSTTASNGGRLQTCTPPASRANSRRLVAGS
eukprot:scaffold4022_cov122-Isochrysis_galbana.AAC.3